MMRIIQKVGYLQNLENMTSPKEHMINCLSLTRISSGHIMTKHGYLHNKEKITKQLQNITAPLTGKTKAVLKHNHIQYLARSEHIRMLQMPTIKQKVHNLF